MILLAEDDPDIADVLVEFLTLDGWAVLHAWDGLEVLELLQQVRPAALLLDLTMPRLSGWELLGRPELHGLPTLILTAVPLSPAELNSLQLPVITKPIPLAQLIGWLEQHAQRT